MLPSLAPELHTSERLPFIMKLRNFMEDHALDDVPTLVLQCSVQNAQVANIDANELTHAMLNGAGESGEGDWWSGFSGGNVRKAFDGLMSYNDNGEPLWVTELHVDGHVLAGIRLKAYSEMDGAHPAIKIGFRHFALLISRLHKVAAIQANVKLTATVVNGNGLRLLGFSGFGGPGRPLARELGRDVLEWPVYAAETPQEISAACEVMKARLARAFP